MNSPTPEQIAAATAEAARLIATAHEAAPIGFDTSPYIVELVADALATRDAEIAQLRTFATRIAVLFASPDAEDLAEKWALSDLPDLATICEEFVSQHDGLDLVAGNLRESLDDIAQLVGLDSGADREAIVEGVEKLYRSDSDGSFAFSHMKHERDNALAEIAALRADLDEIRMWLAFGCLPAETYRPGNEAALKAADAKIGDLRANLATAHRERDEARRALAECTILSGDDTDGNTIENGGWVHLWRGAVDAVRQLRADYDEALDAAPIPAPAFKVGDRVTAENVGALPVGAVVSEEGTAWTGAKVAPNLWRTPDDFDWDDAEIVNVGGPTFIHSLPTPEKP